MDIFFAIIITLVLFGFISVLLTQRSEVLSQTFLWILFGVHILLSNTYLIYAMNSPSDSRKYFKVSSNSEEWLALFGTGTDFVSFLAWPVTRLFGFSYYSAMILFAFLGFIGILLLYIAVKENNGNATGEKNIFGFTELLFVLPNLHFWTASIGKGSVIIFGIGLFFWGLSRFNKRLLYMVLGAAAVYFVRPHILFAIIIAIFIGLLFTNSGIKRFIKVGMLLASFTVIILINDSVLEFAEVTDVNIFDSYELQQKASSLARASSGVDLSSYSLPMKLFTFWLRPLFVDAPNMVGFIVSFENLFYFFLFYIVIVYGFMYWSHLNGWYRICLFTFLLASIALAQVTGNLGIALRQKAQIMPLLFIVAAKLMELRVQFRSYGQLLNYSKN